ncbi:GNAT family N-acetyltransferase [Clostridium oryzae]|uniref:Ribosomal-protein-S5-alanine N-acetyltransferase n=1 Tax=Clostridium oryzae TaxID=1450648 RepID=A0A1V4IPY8_9CLOT|nr:GNAT family N-acetyltransferase [Clostridium oryzae]OPJ62111.1 ribosomal-protein-S5-alanine N-acetyltransferase [Clostridium oryzae]
MNNLGTKKLVTERLILRKITDNDANDMFSNWASDSEVTKFLTWKEHDNINVTHDYIKLLNVQYQSLDTYIWGIELKEVGKVIGSISGTCNEETQSVHISCCIGTKWWNQKIAREALSALVLFFIEEVGANRIEACCDAQNKPAGKVLLRCGFQVEGTLRQSYLSKQGITDISWYAIMRQDYLRKKFMDEKHLNIDNLYLTNYRETGGLHLRSIMRLPKEEAYKIAKQLSENSTASNNRYGDYFERYYEKRQATEEWLYKQFIKNGGKPETRHPIYFVLCECKSFQNFYGNEEQIQIPLKDITNEHISFTPRDSMHIKDMGLTEGTVWSKNQLFNMIRESSKSVSDFILDLPAMYGKPGGYIEVQLWSDKYIEHLL